MSKTNKIIRTFMIRDEMPYHEAVELFQGMVDDVIAGEDPEDVLYETAGLEPDFIFDLLGAVERRLCSNADGGTMGGATTQESTQDDLFS